MGVPAFFRWLQAKFPKVIVDMLEKRAMVIGDTEVPLNLLEPNPNDVEYDNFYVDMNGLIHPCSHPEDREAPDSEVEMYMNVAKYVERLFAAVRPRRLLFLSIDGVAPKAKMNQQRARRFRSAQEARERKEVMESIISEMRANGLDPPACHGNSWDSNVITPGTVFMDELTTFLWFYIVGKMNSDPAWKNIKVVLSDSSDPGEGEHKIMQFIRYQRTQPGYDPNQKHILHGLDADLIMLGLATHEPNFTILREEVTFGRGNRDQVKSQEQMMLDAQSNRDAAAISAIKPKDEWVYAKKLQCLNISVLREYLFVEYQSLQNRLPFPFDFERIIDDFVFICFFVGNDFLPHLPSLDIRDGAIDFLIQVYKEVLPSLGDYLTSPGGIVNLRQVDVILARVGEIEDEVFKMKKQAEDEALARKVRNSNNNIYRGMNKNSTEMERKQGEVIRQSYVDGKRAMVPLTAANPSYINTPPTQSSHLESMKQQLAATYTTYRSNSNSNGASNNMAAADLLRSKLSQSKPVPSGPQLDSASEVLQTLSKRKLEDVDDDDVHASKQKRENLRSDTDITLPDQAMINIEDTNTVEMDTVDAEDDASIVSESLSESDVVDPLAASLAMKASKLEREIDKLLKEKQKEILDKKMNLVTDKIKLHETGWKSRYYGDDFKKKDIEEGGGFKRMCESYVAGLCWVFKYYYAGCCSWDWYYPFHYAPFASDLVNVDTYDVKFNLSQPVNPVEQLLSVLPADSVDALPDACRWLMLDRKSPIVDIYVSEFPMDPNGKSLPWLWVVLLPFVDNQRIKEAIKLVTLDGNDSRRNSFRKAIVFSHIDNLSDEKLQSLAEGEVYESNDILHWGTEYSNSYGIFGKLELLSKSEQRYLPVLFDVDPPTQFKRVLNPVRCNKVKIFQYSFETTLPHKSSLLPGVKIPPPVLNGYDLIPTRPPRLNRGFNITMISSNMRNQQSLSSIPSEQQPFQRMVVNSLGNSKIDYNKNKERFSRDYSDNRSNNYHSQQASILDPRQNYSFNQRDTNRYENSQSNSSYSFNENSSFRQQKQSEYNYYPPVNKPKESSNSSQSNVQATTPRFSFSNVNLNTTSNQRNELSSAGPVSLETLRAGLLQTLQQTKQVPGGISSSVNTNNKNARDPRYNK